MSSETYLIYGKVAPNDWRLLNEIYPEFQTVSIEFDDFMVAKSALGDIKNYLKIHHAKRKVPLTVASRMIIRPLHKQMRMRSVPVFHGPHWGFALERRLG